MLFWRFCFKKLKKFNSPSLQKDQTFYITFHKSQIMSTNPFNRIDAPGFTNEATTFGLKVLDKLNLFDNDDIVAAFPFGKAIQGTWKLLKNYSDPKKAARHSVGKAVGICFGAGLLEYGIEEMKLNTRDEELMAAALQEAREKASVDLPSFNIINIYETEAARRFIDIYFKYFSKSTVPNKEIYELRLRKFLRVWLTLFWRRLMDRDLDKYQVLLDYVKQESFQLEQRIKAQLVYEATLATLYLQTAQNNPNISLSDLYIMPRCEVLESICKEGRNSHVGESKFWECENAGWKTNELHELVNLWLKGELNTDKLRGDHYSLLLLYGSPGQGKTSFCKRLLHDLIGNEERGDRPVYFLQLRRIPEVSKLRTGALDYIAELIAKNNSISIDNKDLYRSILILDGMDELAMSANLTMSEADIVIQELLNVLRHQPNMHVIVTSRHGYLKNDRHLNGALVFQISDLEREQQLEWIGKYYQLKPDSVLSIEAFEKIKPDSELGKLINQPILLQMVADLDSMPENTADRAKVYQLLFDHMVSTPWKKGGENIPALANLSVPKAKRLFRFSLQEMAFRMFLSGRDYLPGSVIEKKIISVQQLMKVLGNEAARDTLQTMYISFYFREVGVKKKEGYRTDSDTEYAMEFVHKSFSEYLVAEYIYRRLEGIYLRMDDYEEFVLNTKEDAVREWNNLMSLRPFSKEIIGYLIDLIKNDSRTEKRSQLKQRLLHFAPAFFANGFLDQKDTRVYKDTAVERGLESFYAWLIVVGHLDERQLPVAPSYRQKLIYFIRLVALDNRPLKLCNSSLYGINLRGVILSDIDFSGSDLSESNFNGAILHRANFRGADLCGAQFDDAFLHNADLSGAELSIVILEPEGESPILLIGNFNRTSFAHANLQNADMGSAYFSGANFYSADLRNANLQYSKIDGANFKKANLYGANLKNANLKGCKNVTFEQLLKTKCLYNCSGLNPDLLAKLKETKPCLFTEEGCLDMED